MSLVTAATSSWVLAVLAILVLALAGVVIVLARSLRTSRRSSTTPARRKVKTSEPVVLQSTESTPPPEEDAPELTRIGPAIELKEIPRLTEEQDESTDSSAKQQFEESIARLLYDSDAQIDIDEPTGPNDLILLSAVGQTDRGIVRRRNEDSFLIDTHRHAFAVADGMGGYGGGDVASRIAVHEMQQGLVDPNEPTAGNEDRPRQGRELIAAIERANEKIFAQANTMRSLKGMGTTIVAARFAPRKQRIFIAHVGDSRCYRFRGGELRLLTSDHTLASRGVEGPLGQNLRRAVGVAASVKVDLLIDKPLPDDTFLLCSDGLCKMVTDEHIRRILAQNEASLDRAAAQLMLAANAGGGRDNITVVLVRALEITQTRNTARMLKGQDRVEFGPSR